MLLDWINKHWKVSKRYQLRPIRKLIEELLKITKETVSQDTIKAKFKMALQRFRLDQEMVNTLTEWIEEYPEQSVGVKTIMEAIKQIFAVAKMQARLEREDRTGKAPKEWGSCKYECRPDGTCRLKEKLWSQKGPKQEKSQNIVECTSHGEKDKCLGQPIKCRQCSVLCREKGKFGKETDGEETQRFTLRYGTKPREITSGKLIED